MPSASCIHQIGAGPNEANCIVDGTQKMESQIKDIVSFIVRSIKSKIKAISIVKADIEDIVAMNKLSHQKRKQYEKEQPVFWRWAGEFGEELQCNWFKQLLSNENYILLAAKDNNELVGLIIGEIKHAPEVYNPGGLVLLVDDFYVKDNQWHEIGKLLLSALKENAKAKAISQIIIICGAHDKVKSNFLNKQRLNIVSNWYVGDI